MQITRVVVGVYQTNCYILTIDQDTIVIDPGSNFKKIDSFLTNLNLKAILLTHGHFDHIGAVDKLVEKYHCPVYCSQDDEKMLRNEQYNTLGDQKATVKSPVIWLDCDELTIGQFQIKILYTPGHTNGSVMFIIDGCLFSGDTLFKNSVGRTDLYSGSSSKLQQSLNILYTLPDEMAVYPGHDESTTIAVELRNNPYLQ